MTEETIQKLNDLKLVTMAKVMRELVDSPPSAQLSWEERIAMLVDREWTDRENRRLARRLKEAKLATRASIEDIVCDATRGIEKATMRQLATCQWVRAKQNVVVIGPTGSSARRTLPPRSPKPRAAAAYAPSSCAGLVWSKSSRSPASPARRRPRSHASRRSTCSCSTTSCSHL